MAHELIAQCRIRRCVRISYLHRDEHRRGRRRQPAVNFLGKQPSLYRSSNGFLPPSRHQFV
jgi:hypothetical protein